MIVQRQMPISLAPSGDFEGRFVERRTVGDLKVCLKTAVPIASLDRIPSFEAVQKLGKAMSAAAGQNAAA